MSKPGKVLRNLCKKLGVRLTVKRGNKRIYKSVAVLKRQCANKKKKKVKRKRKFGAPIERRKIIERRRETRRRTGLYDVPSRDLPYIEDRAAKKYFLERQRLREAQDFDALEKLIQRKLKEYRNRDIFMKTSRKPVNVNKGISKEVKAVDPDSFKYKVEGSKQGSKYYIDLLHMACTCGDFRFRRSNKSKDDPARLCKHIDQIFRQKGISQQQWCEHVGKEGSVDPEVMNALIEKLNLNFGKKKEKISTSLKKLCKKHKVRLTVKRGKKRVYKSVKVLKAQCQRKVKRKRKFGTETTNASVMKEEDFHDKFMTPLINMAINNQKKIMEESRTKLLGELEIIIEPLLNDLVKLDDEKLKKYYQNYKFQNDDEYKRQVKAISMIYGPKTILNKIANLEQFPNNEDLLKTLVKTTNKIVNYFQKKAKYGSKKVKRKRKVKRKKQVKKKKRRKLRKRKSLKQIVKDNSALLGIGIGGAAALAGGIGINKYLDNLYIKILTLQTPLESVNKNLQKYFNQLFVTQEFFRNNYNTARDAFFKNKSNEYKMIGNKRLEQDFKKFDKKIEGKIKKIKEKYKGLNNDIMDQVINYKLYNDYRYFVIQHYKDLGYDSIKTLLKDVRFDIFSPENKNKLKNHLDVLK